MRIILASGSPRRLELLEAAGFEVLVQKPDVDESELPSETPKDLVLRLSKEKALSVERRISQKNQPIREVIIAADTVVVLNNYTIGKPRDKNHAREILRSLSGNTHEVMTGFSVCCGEKLVSKSVSSQIKFRVLSDKEIDNYLKSDEALDKAGAYAVQGKAAFMVDSIEGSVTNIIGLPVKEVLEVIKKIC